MVSGVWKEFDFNLQHVQRNHLLVAAELIASVG